MKETFMKNLAKVKECKNKSSGNGADDGFQPTWYLYKRLLFLMKTCAQTESESNLFPSQPSSAICSDTDLTFHNIYYDENIQVSTGINYQFIFILDMQFLYNFLNFLFVRNLCYCPKILQIPLILMKALTIPVIFRLIYLVVSPNPSSDSAEIISSSTVSTPSPRPASAPMNNDNNKTSM